MSQEDDRVARRSRMQEMQLAKIRELESQERRLRNDRRPRSHRSQSSVASIDSPRDEMEPSELSGRKAGRHRDDRVTDPSVRLGGRSANSTGDDERDAQWRARLQQEQEQHAEQIEQLKEEYAVEITALKAQHSIEIDRQVRLGVESRMNGAALEHRIEIEVDRRVEQRMSELPAGGAPQEAEAPASRGLLSSLVSMPLSALKGVAGTVCPERRAAVATLA